VKQLIDLNGDSTNFDITFKVVSRNHEPFDILVVDQTTLDSNPNLQYKRADKGEISGNLKHENNVYQNYFLILRADSPCECDVEVDKKVLPKGQVQQPQPQPQAQPQQQRLHASGKDGFNWVKILLVVGAIAVAGFVLYWLSKKKSKEDTGEQAMDNGGAGGAGGAGERAGGLGAGFKFYSPAFSSHSEKGSPSASPSPEDNPLLRRLKSLNLS